MKPMTFLAHEKSHVFTWFLILCLFTSPLLLSSCRKSNDDITETSFTAEVVSVTKDTLLVRPEAGTKEYQICSQIYVPTHTEIVDSNGNRLNAIDLTKAKRVQVTYDGVLDNSDPATISNCYEIRVLE